MNGDSVLALPKHSWLPKPKSASLTSGFALVPDAGEKEIHLILYAFYKGGSGQYTFDPTPKLFVLTLLLRYPGQDTNELPHVFRLWSGFFPGKKGNSKQESLSVEQAGLSVSAPYFDVEPDKKGS